MKCIAYRPSAAGHRVGFADIEMPSGIIVRDCGYHVAESTGRRWVIPPARPVLDDDRRLAMRNGRPDYAPVIDFRDANVRRRWSAAAVTAIEEYLSS